MKSAALVLLRHLYRNVLAGARLALALRVGPLDYRVSPADFAVLVGFDAFAALVGGFLRSGPPGYFNLEDLPQFLSQVPIVLLTCLIVAAIVARRGLLLALATALFASDPFFELVTVVAAFTAQWVPPGARTVLETAFLAWVLAATLRALVVLAGWRGVRTFWAGGVLGAMFLGFVFLMPQSELWVHADPDEDPGAAPAPSIAEEQLFHRQQTLLEEALEKLAPQRPGIEDLYFVGVAPYSSQDVFVREMTTVRKMFDQRFGTAGRSIVLANNPGTLADTPIATATNLRAVLEYLGR